MSNKIIVCTYDNPATMCRECWSNGKLLWHYSAQLLNELVTSKRHYCFPIFLGANVETWMPGRLIGDKEAISQEILQILEKHNVKMFSIA